MPTPDIEPKIMACLEQITDPCSAASASPMNLVEMGLIRSVEIDEDGAVSIALRLTSPACFMVGHMAEEAKRLIGPLPGVTAVELIPDAGLDWSPADIKAPAAGRRRRRVAERRLVPAGGREA